MSLGGWLDPLSKAAGLVALLGALVAGIGFTVDPPWPNKDDLKATQKIIETIQRQQTNQIRSAAKQSCVILQLLKDRYLKEQSEAQTELNKNPSSPTLQRARDEAKVYVEYLDSEQRVARCHQFRAPISSSTEHYPMEEQ
jgi:hypothetical protein